jgi:hypothetical protein
MLIFTRNAFLELKLQGRKVVIRSTVDEVRQMWQVASLKEKHDKNVDAWSKNW